MNTQNFITAVRNLFKNRAFSLISIGGLIIGLCVFLVTTHYYLHEQSYDSFIPDNQNIYRVNVVIKENNTVTDRCAQTGFRTYFDIKAQLPDAIATTCTFFEKCLVKTDDQSFVQQRLMWVNNDFEKVFPFQLVKGVAVFDRPLVATISESKAKELFGNQDPISKIFKVNEGIPFEITGVYKDFPSNTHIAADYFCSIKTWYKYGWLNENSDWLVYNYIKLGHNSDPRLAEKRINGIAKDRLDYMKAQNRSMEFSLQPLSDLHYSRGLSREFGATSNPAMLIIICLIGLITLAVAYVNYTNLHAAKMYQRNWEMGLRKLLGADRKSIFSQLFIESVLTNLLSIILAFLIYKLLLPVFNHYFEIPLSASFIKRWYIYVAAFLVLVAGTLYCSIFDYINVLKVPSFKSKSNNRGTGGLKKRFVVVQMMVSIILIFSSIVVFKQINFMQKADLGIGLKGVLAVSGPASTNELPNRQQLYQSFRDELLASPDFETGTASFQIPGEEISFRKNMAVNNEMGKNELLLSVMQIDNFFFDVYGVNLLAGRNFNVNGNKSNDISKVIINKKACTQFNIKSPDEAIGKTITTPNNEIKEIVGVVGDFHNEGLQKAMLPMVFYHYPPTYFGYYSFRININNQNEALNRLRLTWAKHFPQDPLSYFFADEYFNRQYASEKRLSKLFVMFTTLSIFIACLGLYALILFYSRLKIKEIGVRKVNGAKVGEIMIMLNETFLMWIVVAFVIACPIGYFAMQKWLENFAYKTELSWWIFALAGLLALGIALLTVSWQSWKAATRNPVEALRYE